MFDDAKLRNHFSNQSNSMKKLNLIGVLAVAALLFAGCEMSKESAELLPGETTIEATRGAFTKSVLSASDQAYDILWSVPDKILVGYPGVKLAKFTSTNKTKASSASFKGKLPEGEGPLVGIYPATSGNAVDEEMVFSVQFFDEQKAVEGSYDPDAFPSVAIGEGNSLSFQNICGLLEVTVGYSDVTSITLLNGRVTDPVIIEPVDPNEPGYSTRAFVSSVIPAGILSVSVDGEPVIVKYSDEIVSIILNAPSGGYFKKGAKYYISVPPCDFPDGATFYLNRESGKRVQIDIEGEVSVERNKLYPVRELVDPNIPDDYIPDEPGGDEPGGDEPGDEEGIVIDGDMSDWAEIEGTLNKSGNIMEVKGSADDDYIYVYVKRAKSGRWAQLWNETVTDAGYYYFDFDLDNKPDTGDYAEHENGNFECWSYLYLFGSVIDDFIEEPTGGTKGMSISGVKSAGSFTGSKEVSDDGVIEVEVAFPRANLPAITANTIAVSVWGNKDGSPLTKATIKLGEGGDEPGGDEPGGDEPGDDDYINLSADGTANCYIVDAAGAYKFKTVKGNSSESVGSVAGAEIVWETYNNAEEVIANSIIADCSVEDDYICFNTPDKIQPGNALIAAVDASGTILWSWHIWVPATKIVDIDNEVHTYPMMDRNLGAVVATQAAEQEIDVRSIGLCYQWGRKDPFLGPKRIEDGKYPSPATIAEGQTAITFSGAQLTLEESIQNPTVFGKGSNYHWITGIDLPDGTLWGDNADKSIYDPCPPGYRVPLRDKKTLLWKDGLTTDDFTYNTTYHWISMGNPATVFPVAGYRNQSDFKITFRTYIWNAHIDSAYEGYAYNRRFELDGSELKIRNSATYIHHGMAVRCCVE